MATLTSQQITQAGLAETFAAATAGGDKFQPGPNVFLHVKNTNGATRTVTVDSKVNSNYGTDVNVAVVVPATTGDVLIGPFPAGRFAGTDGLASISYSADTGVTIAVVVI